MDLLAQCSLHEVLVAQHFHTSDVEFEFVFIWLLNKDRNGSGHLEKTITQLVAVSVVALDVEALLPVYIRIQAFRNSSPCHF